MLAAGQSGPGRPAQIKQPTTADLARLRSAHWIWGDVRGENPEVVSRSALAVGVGQCWDCCLRVRQLGPISPHRVVPLPP